MKMSNFILPLFVVCIAVALYLWRSQIESSLDGEIAARVTKGVAAKPITPFEKKEANGSELLANVLEPISAAFEDDWRSPSARGTRRLQRANQHK